MWDSLIRSISADSLIQDLKRIFVSLADPIPHDRKTNGELDRPVQADPRNQTHPKVSEGTTKCKEDPPSLSSPSIVTNEAPLNGNMLEEANLRQMNKPEPLNGINGCTELQLCKWLGDYETDLMIANMLAKDIENTVLSFELKQQKQQMQKQAIMFADVLERENNLRHENEMLKHKILDALFREQKMVDMVSKIEADRLFFTIHESLELVIDHVQNYISEQIHMVSMLSDEIGVVQISAEKLSTQSSLLESELTRKDEVAKGLLFDLSLLQESSFVAKDQADELTVATKSLEHALLSISLELDAVVSDRHLLEGQIEKGNEEIAALKVELAKKIGELNMVSTQNAELKSKLKNNHTMKKELADKIEATGRLEVELLQLRSLIEEKNSSFQILQNNLSKLAVEKQYCKTQMLILQENEEMAWKRAEESVAIARESQQIAEKREEYVKLLERSIDDLECTVRDLENRGQGKRHRMQQEELEMKLQKVSQQKIALPPSGKACSSVEDRVVNLAGSSRRPRDVHNELLGAQESMSTLQKEVLGPVKEQTINTVRREYNMWTQPHSEEMIQESDASRSEHCTDAGISLEDKVA